MKRDRCVIGEGIRVSFLSREGEYIISRIWDKEPVKLCIGGHDTLIRPSKWPPSSIISINPISQIRSLKESISTMLPSHPWRSFINLIMLKSLIILKSLIEAQGSDEHQEWIEHILSRKRGLRDLSLGQFTEETQKDSWIPRSFNFTEIENLVVNWQTFSKSFSFHPTSCHPEAPIESRITHSLTRVPPIDRSRWKFGEESLNSCRANKSIPKRCRKF